MDISIEISFYPLAKEAFKDEIWAFIDTLNAVEGLTVVTNGMSTQVFGEYDLAMSTVTQQIKKVHQTTNSAVFVCKFIGGDRSQVEAKA
ncbi:hypothetical protein [Thalassotalea agarivorans]|uniref:YKOF-related Family n=1 Tax=Thalassotalea agarivorans TaxID=349064 RepID=A0A1I0ER63_THASX|nr:hypothetical protein [Thalassotalea agarivorans]SET47297.1 YKOF-related Family [Thalassotalea agarivorans]